MRWIMPPKDPATGMPKFSTVDIDNVVKIEKVLVESTSKGPIYLVRFTTHLDRKVFWPFDNAAERDQHFDRVIRILGVSS